MVSHDFFWSFLDRYFFSSRFYRTFFYRDFITDLRYGHIFILTFIIRDIVDSNWMLNLNPKGTVFFIVKNPRRKKVSFTTKSNLNELR
jgi:hypothetical protein